MAASDGLGLAKRVFARSFTEIVIMRCRVLFTRLMVLSFVRPRYTHPRP
jgi:hypothetical protein